MILELRRKIINWLAGEGIAVIINTTTYDYILHANNKLDKNCLFRRNKVYSLDKTINEELDLRLELAKQGVRKSGNGFVLDPSLQ